MDLLKDFTIDTPRNEFEPPTAPEQTAYSFYDLPSASRINRAVRNYANNQAFDAEDKDIAQNLDAYGQMYAPENTTRINPYEKLLPLNMAYGTSLRNIAECFTGDDPFKFVLDPEKREKLRYATEQSSDPEDMKKRLTLSAFFASGNPLKLKLPQGTNISIATAYRNIDTLCNLYTDGKGGVDMAYNKAKDILSYDANNPAASMPKMLKFNISFQNGVADVGNMIYNLASVPVYMVGAKKYGDAIQQMKHDLYDQYAEAQRDYGIPADWMTNSDGFIDWTFNAMTSTMAYMPSLAVQVGLGAITRNAAPALLGGMFAIDDYFEIRHEKPEAIMGQALIHAGLIGVINGLSEKVTLGIAIGKLQKHYVKAGIGHGIKRVAAYIGVDTLSNAGQEGIEQLAENASDLICGVADKKFSEMTLSERVSYLWQGVPESAFLGATTGAMLSAGNVKSMQKIYDQTSQGYQVIAREKADLETKAQEGKLTEAEAARLRYYNNALDSANAETCFNAAIADQQWQTIKAMREEGERRKAEREAQGIDTTTTEEDNITPQSENKERVFSDDEEAGDVSAQTWEAAEQAEHNLRMREANGTHDRADTIQAVVSFFRNLPNIKFRILNSEQDIPQGVIDDLAADGIKPSQMQAAVGKDGVVYIRADKVPPSEVEHVLTHETIGHIGLENFMGGKFVTFLDEVYDQHFQEMDDIRRLYKLGGQEDSPQTRRKITREWLAELAAKSTDTRPDFWTRITAQLRVLMHKLGFKSYWSDRDLAALFIADRKQLVTATPDLLRENINEANAPMAEEARFRLNNLQEPPTVVKIPPIDFNIKDTAEVKRYLFDHFKGMEITIKSDGRLVGFYRRGLEATLKRRDVNRQALPALDQIVIESYPAGYEQVDARHAEKRNDLQGQFIYGSLIELTDTRGNKTRYVATIKLDDSSNNTRAQFKDISIKEADRTLSIARTHQNADVELSGLKPSASGTIQQLIESVRSDFKETPLFSMEMPTTRSGMSPSLSSKYSSADSHDFIAVLKTAVGTRANKNDSIEKWQNFCKEHHLNIDAEDIMAFVTEARAANRLDAWQERTNAIEDYIIETDEIFHGLSQIGYSPREVYLRKIVPTAETSGGKEFFTGNFIHDTFRGTENTNDTEAGRKARQRRRVRQQNAATRNEDRGMLDLAPLTADDIADQINRKMGTSYTDEDIELHFRNLSWEDLERKYRDHLKDEKELADYYKDLGLEEEHKRIEDEAMQIVENPHAITMEYAQEEPKVVKKLWELVTPPNDKGKWNFSIDEENIAKLNEKLIIASKDSAAITELFKTQRAKQREDYQARLNNLRRNIKQREIDLMQLQRDARAFVDEALPETERYRFYDMIMKLPSYGYTPTVRNPEGRRVAEFNKILDKVLKRQEEVRRDLDIADIKKMLDSAKQKRNYKNIPVSIIPSEQSTVDFIREVVSWSPDAVASALDYTVQKLKSLEDSQYDSSITAEAYSDIQAQREQLEKKIYFISQFGNLEYRKADEAQRAKEALHSLIRGAKSDYKLALEERAKSLNEQREALIRKLTGGTLTDTNADTGFLTKIINSNATLKTLLSYLEGDPTDFNSTWSGQLYRRIEDASYNSAAQRQHQDEALQKAFSDIFQAKDAKQRARVIQELRTIHEHTGALIRFYTRVNGNVTFEGRHGKVHMPLAIEDNGEKKGARSIVQMYDAYKDNPQKVQELFHSIYGAPGQITPASIEWLRQQIADADAGVERVQDVYGDDLDNAAMERMQDDIKEKRVELICDSPKTQYEMREVQGITKAQALQIILTWEQDGYRDAMEWNGWTKESIDALKKFVGNKNLEFGYWMRDRIAQNRDALDEAVYNRFGAHLPDNKNYWPGRFKNDRSSVIRPQGHDAVGSLSITPGFLTARRFHLQPVATDIDAIEVFLNNQNQQIHMLEFGDVMRDAQGVLGNATVQKAIMNRYGEHAPRMIMQLLGNIANQGAISDNISTSVGALYSAYIPAKIGLNPASLLKQLLGGAAYALDVPMKDMAGAMFDVMRLTPQYRHFRELAKNSDYFKVRIAQGANPELQYINEKQLYGNAGMLKWLADFATSLTTKSDAVACLTTGYASFKYAHDNAIKAGKTETEADAIALRAWQVATDETQQSGALKDANQYMAARGLARAFTMFMSNPIQTMQNEVRAYRTWQNADQANKDATFKKFARIATINHLIIPSLMYFVTKMFRDNINPLEWEWSKEDFVEMLAASLLGSFEGLFIYGVLVKGLIEAFAGGSTSRTPEAVPALEGIIKGGATTNKIATALMEGEDVTAQDILSFTAGAGAMLEPAGILWQPLGDAGMLLDIVGTQGKRINRLYQNATKDDAKKKHK